MKSLVIMRSNAQYRLYVNLLVTLRPGNHSCVRFKFL